MAVRKITNTEAVTDDIHENNEFSDHNSKRKELNLLKHTETIDKLVVQNKNLQKELDDAYHEINVLEDKLNDHSIKISKNMLFIFLGIVIVLAWLLNSKIIYISTSLTESKQIMQEYKNEIEKIKLYNDVLHEQIIKNKE